MLKHIKTLCAILKWLAHTEQKSQLIKLIYLMCVEDPFLQIQSHIATLHAYVTMVTMVNLGFSVILYLRIVQLYPVHPVLHPQTFGLMQIPPL